MKKEFQGLLKEDLAEREDINQICEKLAEALEGYKPLFDNEDIIRNTENDSEYSKFIGQSLRVTKVIGSSVRALEEYRKWKENKNV